MNPKMQSADAAKYLNVSLQAIHKNIKTNDLIVSKSQNKVYFSHETAKEIFKLKENCLSDINIHFWRTQSGAEVDFVLFRNAESILPIEVKYRNMKDGLVTKSLHSFLEAYQPKQAVVITKNYIDTKIIGGCEIKFIPFSHLDKFLKILQSFMT